MKKTECRISQYTNTFHFLYKFLVVMISIFVLYQGYELFNKNLKIKRFENYNYFNKVYADWYEDMYSNFVNRKNCGKNEIQISKNNFDLLNENSKAIIRRYFNLYSQEYYSYLNHLIPSEMWTDVIHGPGCKGAAVRNLARYPFLLDGYHYWKKLDDFSFPNNFNKMLKTKLIDCEEYIESYREKMNDDSVWCQKY